MVQKGPGFNFLYITAWFNLTWDFCGPTVFLFLTAKNINGKSQGGKRGKRAKVKQAPHSMRENSNFLMKILTATKVKVICQLPDAARQAQGIPIRRIDIISLSDIAPRPRSRPSNSYNPRTHLSGKSQAIIVVFLRCTLNEMLEKPPRPAHTPPRLL